MEKTYLIEDYVSITFIKENRIPKVKVKGFPRKTTRFQIIKLLQIQKCKNKISITKDTE